MEKDVVQIRCLSDKERYADLINGIVFGGRQVVHGEDIQEMDSQTGLWQTFPRKKTVKTGKKFRDLRQIFDFIRMSEDKKGLKRLVQEDAAYQNMDEDAYDMAVAYTNAAELIAVKEFHRKDGKVNMCKALTELIEEGREEGREEGIIGMIRDNLDRGAAQDEIVEKLCRYFGMSSDKAWEYLNRIYQTEENRI